MEKGNANRESSMLRHIMIILFFLMAHALNVCAQESPKPDDEDIDDTNPTKPVFLSLREEYYNLTDDRYRNSFIIRNDKIVLKDNTALKPKGLIFRFEVPISTVHVPGRTETGLGDIYFQGLIFPHLKPLTLGVGTGFLLPTATNSLTGQGKWQAA